jgi:hypothetical protein
VPAGIICVQALTMLRQKEVKWLLHINLTASIGRNPYCAELKIRVQCTSHIGTLHLQIISSKWIAGQTPLL